MNKVEMTPSDVILLANGFRYRLGNSQVLGQPSMYWYAQYEKTPGEWRESSDVNNMHLQRIFENRANFKEDPEVLDFEKTADQNKIDLSKATKVVYPAEDSRNDPEKVDLGNKYHRVIYGFCGKAVVVDIYRVLDAYTTGSAGLDHAVKKILMPGTRGHKDRLKDLREAANSVNQAIKLEEQKLNAQIQNTNKS